MWLIESQKYDAYWNVLVINSLFENCNWDQRCKYWHNLPLGSSSYILWFEESEPVLGGGGGKMSGLRGGGGGKMSCPITGGGGGSVRRWGGSGGRCCFSVSDCLVTSLTFFVTRISRPVSINVAIEISEMFDKKDWYYENGVLKLFWGWIEIG